MATASSSSAPPAHRLRLRPLWRIAQGVGGTFLFANASALVTDAFAREQLGVAMGTNTMVAAVGLVLGPVLGGALVSISWPWVFWHQGAQGDDPITAAIKLAPVAIGMLVSRSRPSSAPSSA